VAAQPATASKKLDFIVLRLPGQRDFASLRTPAGLAACGPSNKTLLPERGLQHSRPQGICKMATSAPTQSSPKERDPHLPPLGRLGDLIVPMAPHELEATGLESTILTDLVLRLAYGVSRITTEWVSKQLHISPALARDVLDKLA